MAQPPAERPRASCLKSSAEKPTPTKPEAEESSLNQKRTRETKLTDFCTSVISSSQDEDCPEPSAKKRTSPKDRPKQSEKKPSASKPSSKQCRVPPLLLSKEKNPQTETKNRESKAPSSEPVLWKAVPLRKTSSDDEVFKSKSKKKESKTADGSKEPGSLDGKPVKRESKTSESEATGGGSKGRKTRCRDVADKSGTGPKSTRPETSRSSSSSGGSRDDSRETAGRKHGIRSETEEKPVVKIDSAPVAVATQSKVNLFAAENMYAIPHIRVDPSATCVFFSLMFSSHDESAPRPVEVKSERAWDPEETPQTTRPARTGRRRAPSGPCEEPAAIIDLTLTSSSEDEDSSVCSGCSDSSGGTSCDDARDPDYQPNDTESESFESYEPEPVLSMPERRRTRAGNGRGRATRRAVGRAREKKSSGPDAANSSCTRAAAAAAADRPRRASRPESLCLKAYRKKTGIDEKTHVRNVDPRENVGPRLSHAWSVLEHGPVKVPKSEPISSDDDCVF